MPRPHTEQKGFFYGFWMVNRLPDINIYAHKYKLILLYSFFLSLHCTYSHATRFLSHIGHSCKQMKQLFSSFHCCHILFRNCHCPGDKESIIILGPQGNKRATSQPWLRGDVGSWAPHVTLGNHLGHSSTAPRLSPRQPKCPAKGSRGRFRKAGHEVGKREPVP